MPQLVVLGHGIGKVLKDNWPNTPPLQVIADCLGKQAGNILMRLFRQLPEFLPDLLFNLGTDFYCSHAVNVVDIS